ncbi:MAG TPA: hypothetical protein VK627_02140, partial [Edaphobacter sp.]|nr:hypothetical protein [Edaphobacter sp.]
TPLMINRHTLLPLALLLGATTLQAQKTPIQITADLSEAPRKLYHAEVDIPVQPGPVSLTTPKWIPGNHRPTGPVDDITGVVFTANGKVLPWRRDDEDLYQFHVTVPAGWGIGTALTPTDGYDPQHPKGGTTHYAPTTVEQLEDSPIITGEYFHEFALAPEVTPKHYIDVVSDEPEDSNLRPALLAELNNLVRETGAMYASRHYNVYHLLLTLSDTAGGQGLEHGQSSDNGVGEKGFSDDAHQLAESDLLAHEFTHSWNGKYRRPATLYQPDFATAQQGQLLWVYEGMTQYLGNVLAARSGLKSQDQYRDILALSAANLDYKPGRDWRSTEDTAIASSILRGGSPAWSNWKRGQDYYQEGELLWLDADTLIRKLTGNKKSLNDFEHLFLGKGGNTGPLIVPYDREELIADLNQIVKYDWATFLHDRIDKLNPRADLAGIEQGGYKLVYTDKPSKSESTMSASGGRRGGLNVWYSIGIRLMPDGTIADVRWGGPADKARLAPGSKILAINGRVFSTDELKAAIDQSKGKTEPMHLILQTNTFVDLADLDYHDGARYPSLVRVEGTPAYLDDITKPLAKHETAPTKPESN